MLLSRIMLLLSLPLLQLLVEVVMQGVDIVVTPIVLSCISELWLVDKTGERIALVGGEPGGGPVSPLKL